MTSQTFGEQLRDLRSKAGLTQAQLAERSGLHRQGIAKLEGGEREPSWATVQALARALGVDCTAFQTEAEAPAPEPAAKARKAPPADKPARGKGKEK